MSTSSSSSSSDLTDGVYWMPETPLPLASDAIQIHQLPGEVKFTDETVQNTQDYWDNVIVPSNPKTFDGRVWGVRQWRSVGPNKLQVDLQRSWYRYQLYLHFSPRALEIPEKLNPFGCCSITLVDNGTAIMAGRRSSKVACCPNMWHLTPAGTIDIDDPVAVIKKEMLEELGIPGDPLDVRLLGLFNTGREQAYKPELVFVIDLGSMKSSGVLAGVKNEAVDNWEHSRIRAVVIIGHSRYTQCIEALRDLLVAMKGQIYQAMHIQIIQLLISNVSLSLKCKCTYRNTSTRKDSAKATGRLMMDL